MAIPTAISTSLVVVGGILTLSCGAYTTRQYSDDGIPTDDLFFISFYSFMFSSGVFLYLIPAALAIVNGEPPEWGLSGHMKRLAMLFGALVLTLTSFDAIISRTVS